MNYRLPALGLILGGLATPALATNAIILENPACSLATGCLFSGNANPATVDDIETAYNGAKDPDIDLTWLGATDDSFGGNGQLSGSWSFAQPVDYIAVKAGNQFMLYFVGGATSGSWSTAGLVNPNGNQHPQLGLSHLAFYSGLDSSGNPQGVPEPASWAMMLGGFGLTGGAMRARKKTRITFA